MMKSDGAFLNAWEAMMNLAQTFIDSRKAIMNPARALLKAVLRPQPRLGDPGLAPALWRSADLPKVVVLSVSAGAGHVRAAQALCAGSAGLGLQTIHLEVMDYVPRWFRRLYTDMYIRMVASYPQAWGCLYRGMHLADPHGLVQRIRRRLERRLAARLLQTLRGLQPDAIVCTHFMPAELLGFGARRDDCAPCPVFVQVTDFDLHRMWIQPGVTGYFVGSDEIAFRLRAAGVPARRIQVTGLPVMPEFSAPPARTPSARALGLDPTRATILLMGGGFGLGDFTAVAARLLAIDDRLQLIVVTGKNQARLAALAPLAAQHPGRFLPFGHVHDIARLMACADIAVTKPGGMTSAECLAMGLPMILNAPIPGQEERNADYLVEQGVALKAIDAVTVEYRVRQLLLHPARLTAMAARARALGQADAAAVAMRQVEAQVTP